jgi:lysyl-tRNA synthetase class 2
VSLTGVPLIVVAVLVTAVTVAATWRLWSRYGRWRLVCRVMGILLVETLSVFTVGLVVNRVEQFYPSWEALAGDTGTAVVTAARHAGRIDGLVHGRGADALPWRPAGVSAWRLAATPMMVVPAGYLGRRSVTFPAVLSLVDAGPDSAAAIVATTRQAALAVRLIRYAPARFGALVVVDGSVTAQSPHDLPGGEVALAVVRPAPRHGTKAPALPASAAALTGTGSPAWTVAEEWAAGECSLPLAAPVQLPPGYVRDGKPRPS